MKEVEKLHEKIMVIFIILFHLLIFIKIIFL